ncbi:hypothetical protein GCM10022220_27070 [Actinocatenispora rupis]|uniref:Uncharacterized protein n=2 Tax=Actinocatenispora rupis TaxID=519421 RepID=A0A8J3NDD8_9ACTN|nr:hypothetical protein Aru02nite_22730 [Actinocatenispora rupis]
MTQEGANRVAAVLDDLGRAAAVHVNSTDELARQILRATTKNDEDRARKDWPQLRRKTDLHGVTPWLSGPVRIAPWQALHQLAHVTALDEHGGGRGLAAHWTCLKYCQALHPAASLELSDEGDTVPKRHYKTAQSDELTRAFACHLGEQLMRQRYPDHAVNIVDADLVLRAGWIRAASTRPFGLKGCLKYFVEAWRPGEPSKVLLVIAHGTHGKGTVNGQLARATAHADFVQLGPYGELPTLLVSTELSRAKGVIIHALATPGEAEIGALPAHALQDRNFFPDMHIPGVDKPEPGFQLPAEDFEWFASVLAHTEAAGLMAFAGSVDEVNNYLTKQQRKSRPDRLVMPGISSVCDTEHRLHGHHFVGTDHVFRLHGVRLEVFSGLREDLHRLLVNGPGERAEHLRAYREAAYQSALHRPTAVWDLQWGGPAHIAANGAVLAIRRLR